MKNTIPLDSRKLRILIIGANGFLGTKILEIGHKLQNSKRFMFLAADIKNDHIDSKIPFYNIDITNHDLIIEKISKINPDIIIHTAAMTDVDGCEVNKSQAEKINVKGTKNVIAACKDLKVKLIFLSTDFIFDGQLKKNDSYKEDDLPNPLSFYGLTKYKAELAIYSSGIDFLVCRTSVLYGLNPYKLNFITWVLKKLKNHEEISIVTTQINSPTYVDNLAQIILELVDLKISGIVNTAGNTILNRYEIAQKTAEIFNLNENLINPIDTFEQKALRPKNAGLDISKLENILGSRNRIFSLEEGLKSMKKEFNDFKFP